MPKIALILPQRGLYYSQERPTHAFAGLSQAMKEQEAAMEEKHRKQEDKRMAFESKRSAELEQVPVPIATWRDISFIGIQTL